MTAITIEKFAGKMNRLGYEAFLQAMRQARGDGNRNVELSHWLFHATLSATSSFMICKVSSAASLV